MRVVVDDLAFFAGGAIARPVNAELGATTPLMRRLEVAGGEALRKQLCLTEPLAVGAAVVTGAGDLPAELLVHGVVASRTERVTRDTVRRAFQSVLHRAADWRIRRLAVAPFGLGAGNLDVEESADVMSAVVARAPQGRLPEELLFVVETDDEARAFAAALARGTR